MNCHNFAENYYEVNLLILLLTVALNSWAATIVHRLSFLFSHNILVLFVGKIMIMISGKTYYESFSLFRKEGGGGGGQEKNEEDMMMMIRHCIVRVHPRDVTSRTLSLPGATLPALPYLKVWQAYHILKYGRPPISQSMGGLLYLILYYFFGGTFKKTSHISKYGRPTIYISYSSATFLITIIIIMTKRNS